MTNETETVTITQTAPDGTETKIEITQTPPEGSDGESLVDEIIEAIFDDVNDDGEITEEDLDSLTDTEYSVSETDPSVTETDESETNTESDEVVYETQDSNTVDDSSQPVSIEDSGSSEVFVPTDYDVSTEQTPFVADAPEISLISDQPASTDSSSIDSSEATELAEQEAHSDAARDAQEAADDFVASGDYEAASQARETAENEAWEAGDDSMLSGSNATELDNAATEQDNADYYREQQEEFTAKGDYESAHEAAEKVVENTSDADWYASGDDHSTQARNDEYQLENAVGEENDADWYATNAEEFAKDGNFDAASDYAETAGEHLEAADDYAESTMDGSTYDATSDVNSGGSYDAMDYSADAGTDYSDATDYSSYDAGADYSTIDTSTTDYSTE